MTNRRLTKPKATPQTELSRLLSEATLKVGPPSSDDAERAILSCFLHAPQLLDHPIKEDWFHNPIYLEVYQLFKRVKLEGKPVEYIALSDRMRVEGLESKVGGPAFLADVLDFVPTPTHFKYYLDTMAGKHLARMALYGAMSVAVSSYGHEVADIEAAATEALTSIIESARALQKRKSMGDELDEWELGWEAMAKGEKQSALPTRWASWNKMAMGIRPGYSVIMGRRGSGKSVLAQNILTDACFTHDMPALYISYEMKARMILNRIISDLGAIHGAYLFSPDIAKPSNEEYANLRRTINQCVDRIRKSKLEVVHDVTMGPEAVVSKIKAFHAKHGKCAVAVDYLQLIKPPKTRRSDNREQEIAGISAMLRDLSKELDIPLYALSQVNKDGQSRESNAPEQDADDIALIQRQVMPDGSVSEGGVSIMKNRNGELGHLPLHLKGELFRFVEPSITDYLP